MTPTDAKDQFGQLQFLGDPDAPVYPDGDNSAPETCSGCYMPTEECECIDCPSCGYDLDSIGCEKTTICENCGREWKYASGAESLEEVQEDDPIYWDR